MNILDLPTELQFAICDELDRSSWRYDTMENWENVNKHTKALVKNWREHKIHVWVNNFKKNQRSFIEFMNSTLEDEGYWKNKII